MNQAIVIVSGGFDPVHAGHIEYFQEAAQIGKVIVALNSDQRLTRKKWKPFMSRPERRTILLEMRSISEVIAFEDDEEWSACDGILKISTYYAWSWTHLYFAKWGDRKSANQAQDLSKDVTLCHELGIEVVYDVGKSGKIQSSSRLLKNRDLHEKTKQ